MQPYKDPEVGVSLLQRVFSNPVCEKTFVALPRIYGLKTHTRRNRFKTKVQPTPKNSAACVRSVTNESVLNLKGSFSDNHILVKPKQRSKCGESHYLSQPRIKSHSILDRLNRLSPIIDFESSHKVSFTGMVLPPISRGLGESSYWQDKHQFGDQEQKFDRIGYTPINEVLDQDRAITPELQQDLVEDRQGSQLILRKNKVKNVELDEILVQTPVVVRVRQETRSIAGSEDTYFRQFVNRQPSQGVRDTQSFRAGTSVTSIPIPHRTEIVAFIENYRPLNKQFSLKQLAKTQKFRVLTYRKGIYLGEVSNKQKHGLGVLITEKSVFQGSFIDGSKHRGSQSNSEGTYTGEMLNGKRQFKGTFTWTNGEIYDGQWKDGMKHGMGYWKSPSGDSYQGMWCCNRQEGHGTHQHQNSIYKGQFKDFLKEGSGKESFNNGDIYQGEYRCGKPNGYGEYTWNNGNCYRGIFVNGLRQGQGVLTEGDIRYTGHFKRDFKHGLGQIRYSGGSKSKCEFVEDKLTEQIHSDGFT